MDEGGHTLLRVGQESLAETSISLQTPLPRLVKMSSGLYVRRKWSGGSAQRLPVILSIRQVLVTVFGKSTSCDTEAL